MDDLEAFNKDGYNIQWNKDHKINKLRDTLCQLDDYLLVS